MGDTASRISTPSLPSLPDEASLDLPEFENSLLDLNSNDSPPYDQPTIQGLISDEHPREN